MAESYTPRMGVRRWTDNGDTFTRDELDLSFQNIEERAAIYGNGTLAARPAAGVQGRFYLLDVTEPDAAQRGQLYYDTGTAWVMVKFDLTAILATKANASHSHAIGDLPAANNGEVSGTKFVKADDARLVSDWEAGDLLWSAGTTRTGFLLCNGGSYSTATYAALFAKIGYTFGGASGTFNVPDLRDRSPIGVSATKSRGQVGGSETKVIAAGNLPQHSHTMAHTHTMSHGHTASSSSAGSHSHGGATGNGAGSYYGIPTGRLDSTGFGLTVAGSYANRVLVGDDTLGPDNHVHSIPADGAHSHPVTVNNFSGSTSDSSTPSTGSVGSGTALDVMNPWLALNCFIKT